LRPTEPCSIEIVLDFAVRHLRGHHVAIRTPNLETDKRWYVEKLDFRVIANGTTPTSSSPTWRPQRTITSMSKSRAAVIPRLWTSVLTQSHYHFCVVDETIESLRSRGVTIVTEPFELPTIGRRLAFFCDPFGNLIELAEVLP